MYIFNVEFVEFVDCFQNGQVLFGIVFIVEVDGFQNVVENFVVVDLDDILVVWDVKGFYGVGYYYVYFCVCLDVWCVNCVGVELYELMELVGVWFFIVEYLVCLVGVIGQLDFVDVFRYMVGKWCSQVIVQVYLLFVVVLYGEYVGVWVVCVGQEFIEVIGVFKSGCFYWVEFVLFVDVVDFCQYGVGCVNVVCGVVDKVVWQVGFQFVWFFSYEWGLFWWGFW